MNKAIIIGITISAIASVMIVNFPSLIAQIYGGGGGGSGVATPEQIEECKKLGIPEFTCSEHQILAKKRVIASYGFACGSSDLACRVTNLENDVRLLKEKLGIEYPQQTQQKTAISVNNEHIWYNQLTGGSVGAFVVRNSGDKVIAVDSISIRGASVPFSNWYYALDVSDIGELGPNKFPLSGASCTSCIDKDNNGAGDTAGTQATGPLTLQTGQTAVIYYMVPSGKITASDTGASATVSIFAGSAGSVQTVTVAQI